MAHHHQQQQQQQGQQNPHPNQDQDDPFINYRPVFFTKETSLKKPDGVHPEAVPDYFKFLQLEPSLDESGIRQRIKLMEDDILSVADANMTFLKEARLDLLDPLRRQQHDLARQIETYDVMFLEPQRIKDFHISNSWNAYEVYSYHREKGLQYRDQKFTQYTERLNKEKAKTEQASLLLANSQTSHIEELHWQTQIMARAEREAVERALRDEKARADKEKESADLMAEIELNRLKRRAVSAAKLAIVQAKEASAAHYRAQQKEAKAEEAMSMAEVQNDPLLPVRVAEYRAAVAAAKTATSSQAVLRKIVGGIFVTAEDFKFGLGMNRQEIEYQIDLAAAMERRETDEKKLGEVRVRREAAEKARIIREQQEARKKAEEMARIARERRDQALAREQQETREKAAQRERRERRNQKPAGTHPASPVNQTKKVTKSKSKSKSPTSRAQKVAEALLEALTGRRGARGAVKEEGSRATRVREDPLDEDEGGNRITSRERGSSTSTRAEKVAEGGGRGEEEEEEEGSSGSSSGGSQSSVSVKAEQMP